MNRDGDWKLIKGCPGIGGLNLVKLAEEFDFFEYIENYINLQINSTKTKPVNARYLFNIKEDPLEENNLVEQRPDIVAQLDAKLNEMKKNLVFPLNRNVNLNRAVPRFHGDKWAPGILFIFIFLVAGYFSEVSLRSNYASWMENPYTRYIGMVNH